MSKKNGRWYYGGLASCGAACFTHPLDLVKVHLQTVAKGDQSLSMTRAFGTVLKKSGVFALYQGLSASLLRQITYSTTRFALYETGKKAFDIDSFYKRVGLAMSSGAIGGLVGTPADLVNVRMQNDLKLPFDQRRNYKHAFDGLIQVIKNEGFVRVMSGWQMTVARGAMMTLGQIAMYDVNKNFLLHTVGTSDSVSTHLLASSGASVCATFLTQPVDVLKTRLMNTKSAANVFQCIRETATQGIFAFYKGSVPALIRLAPHTILMFVFLEQLKQRF